MFEAVYFINLDARTDRRGKFEVRAMEAGFDQFIRYPAVSLTNAEADAFAGLVKHPGDEKYAAKLSSSLSHYNVIKEAKERDYEAVLIFEDDAVFCADFEEKFKKYLEDLETIPNWDIAYLGGSPEPDFHDKVSRCHKVSEYWWSCPAMWCAHAYIIHRRFYDRLLAVNPAVVYPWDMNLIHYPPKDRIYLISRELLVIQDDSSRSDLVGEVVSRNSIFQHYYEQYVK